MCPAASIRDTGVSCEVSGRLEPPWDTPATPASAARLHPPSHPQEA